MLTRDPRLLPQHYARAVLARAPQAAVLAYDSVRRHRSKPAAPARARAKTPEASFEACTGAIVVSDDAVLASQRWLAMTEANRAAALLGSDAPRVRWFQNARGADRTLGWFYGGTPDSIWLHVGVVNQTQLSEVVLHECQHRDDFLGGRPMTEEAADAFARSNQLQLGRGWLKPPAGWS